MIYKLLDTLSTRLVASAPKVEERVTAGEAEVGATFHASVKKSISATGKVKILSLIHISEPTRPY